MFKSKIKDGPPITNTVIGEGIRIEGAIINGIGSLRVDGTVIGDVSIDGNIIIGETGYIKGNVQVNNVLCAGRVDGHVLSMSGVHLTSNGRLNGNITSNALVIDEGAMFSGSCQMAKDLDLKSPLIYNQPNNIDTESPAFVTMDTDPNLSYDKT
ncbi:MAG: polymer-forming cytoskeletal protein [Clostridiales bacterium]|jgi:cytoskeletal protein CcmA (bactofilin family)|nr:polymer-forming cytoskeletal protein [Clostridiales bacterium]